MTFLPSLHLPAYRRIGWNRAEAGWIRSLTASAFRYAMGNGESEKATLPGRGAT
ncbi:MAG: hypothetical protein U1F61_02630 [Opitutaceae bacterium]